MRYTPPVSVLHVRQSFMSDKQKRMEFIPNAINRRAGNSFQRTLLVFYGALVRVALAPSIPEAAA